MVPESLWVGQLAIAAGPSSTQDQARKLWVGQLAVAASWQLRGGREPHRVLLLTLSAMTFSGWIAVLAGWDVTEIGRQPWIVQDLISVQEVVADHASATMTGTLLGYVLLYAFLLVSYIGAMRHMATKPAASQVLGPVTFTTQPSAQH